MWMVQGCRETDLRWVKALPHDSGYMDGHVTGQGTGYRVTQGEGSRARVETSDQFGIVVPLGKEVSIE
jgi:hypothetical protein